MKTSVIFIQNQSEIAENKEAEKNSASFLVPICGIFDSHDVKERLVETRV